MSYTYERYRFNGMFNQSLPQNKYDTIQQAEEAQKRDESMGIKVYSIVQSK
jgi:hypothetical protein